MAWRCHFIRPTWVTRAIASELLTRVLCQYGRIDYLVNNAAAAHDRTALKMSPMHALGTP